MSDAPKASGLRRATGGFEPAFTRIFYALSETERQRQGASALSASAKVLASVSAPLDRGAQATPLREDTYFSVAGDDDFDLASSVAREPDKPDDADAIAKELGVLSQMGPAELRRRRRKFMWENHPDRSPAQARDVANRRVAIANMLFDRAERGAAKG